MLSVIIYVGVIVVLAVVANRFYAVDKTHRKPDLLERIYFKSARRNPGKLLK